jgi:hypothetical protein
MEAIVGERLCGIRHVKDQIMPVRIPVKAFPELQKYIAVFFLSIALAWERPTSAEGRVGPTTLCHLFTSSSQMEKGAQ